MVHASIIRPPCFAGYRACEITCLCFHVSSSMVCFAFLFCLMLWAASRRTHCCANLGSFLQPCPHLSPTLCKTHAFRTCRHFPNPANFPQPCLRFLQPCPWISPTLPQICPSYLHISLVSSLISVVLWGAHPKKPKMFAQ